MTVQCDSDSDNACITNNSVSELPNFKFPIFKTLFDRLAASHDYE